MKTIIRISGQIILKLLTQVSSFLGYNLEFTLEKNASTSDCKEVNLNIGAGSRTIPGFKSLDIYTPHYYKSKAEFTKNRVEYDLRGDELPYEDDSVDNIYISHVIEHVETKFVIKFIFESYRVLKKGGVLRIACPDGLFVYKVSQFNNRYWDWRHKSFSNKEYYKTDWEKIEQYDFLLRETSTPRCQYYVNKISKNTLPPADIKGLSYKEFKEKVRTGLVFRKEYPGDHINVWDFMELKEIAQKANFKHIVESKYKGSVSAAMRNIWFDKTAPQMSLYIDFVK